MKTIAHFILFAGIALFAAQATARAEHLQAAIPFNFQAAGATFPAGEYTLLADSSTPNYVSLRNAATGRVVAFLGGTRGALGANPPATLEFHRYGDSYFLRELRTSGNSIWLFPVTRAEREATAASGSGSPTVALVVGILKH